VIRIDEPDEAENVMYYSNCLTCNDLTNMILCLAMTMDKYEAMIKANDHILECGDGHQVCITYMKI
jgi:hypothetical protein